MFQVRGTVPAIVLDAGSHTVKAGIAGEDLPHTLLSSTLAVHSSSGDGVGMTAAPPGEFVYDKPPVVSHAVTRRRDSVDVAEAFGADGLISNWDHFETLLGHTIHSTTDALGEPTPPEHALLYAEPNHNGRAARERLTELLFEKFAFPAFYLARSAVLAAYANGRTTGIVLDIGHSGTSAVPVVEGSIVKDRILRTQVGGHSVRQMMKSILLQRQVALRPLWSFNSKVERSEDGDMVLNREFSPVDTPKVTQSFHGCARDHLVDEITAAIAKARDTPGRPPANLPNAGGAYELPDGQTIELGNDIYLAAESTVFHKLPHVAPNSGHGHGNGVGETRPSHVAAFAAHLGAGTGAPVPMLAASDGLHGLVLDTIRKCDPQTHRDLYAGVCLTGGTSDMSGLFERLSMGLMERYPKVRVLAATGSHERKYCAWTGGSILATFAEFQKNWFSKAEYEENGTSFIHRKCP